MEKSIDPHICPAILSDSSFHGGIIDTLTRELEERDQVSHALYQRIMSAGFKLASATGDFGAQTVVNIVNKDRLTRFVLAIERRKETLRQNQSAKGFDELVRFLDGLMREVG